MKILWIIALVFHLIEDKRLDSEIKKTPFIIQTVSRII